MGDNENARNQAKAQLDSIKEMVAALECDYERLEELKDERAALQDDAAVLAEWDAENGEELLELTDAAGDCENEEEARQRIEEDALSVEVRGDWHSPGDSDGSTPTEYKILLCTGGPAVQIIGDLDEHGQPETARLMCQDWFTAWEEYMVDSDEKEALLTYARVFYWGD